MQSAKCRVVSGMSPIAFAVFVNVLSLGAAVPVAAQTATAPAPVPVNRAARDTWTPVMDVLKAQRRPVTDAQLARLAELPIEAVWGGLQGQRYQHCFVTGFQTTQPTAKLVGRALTMRYLPVRPDLQEAVDTLAKEGDWDFQYNVRAGEDAKAGDVIVVEQGGMVTRATFMGDVTGLGMKMAGVKGVIIDGGLRDLSEFLPWKDFPVYYLGSHASAMADQVGVEWNVPIRLGAITVLPGDVVIADASGVLAFPPQLTDEVIKSAEDTVYTENFKREMMRSRKYRARDIYPKLSPELEKVFAEWQKTHQKEGVKPN
jgi:4-hydroxy-4-methyl-2-oxoglutarate aldolase